MLNKFIQCLVLFVFLTKCNCDEVSHTDRCVLPLKPDWSFFSPLIFTENGTLISTENVSEELLDITLYPGNEVLLSCAPNYFREFPSEKVMKAVCKNDTILAVNSEEKNFVSELSCEVRAIEEIIVPVHGCPAQSRSIEYGYTNPVNEQSYVLGEACINKIGKTEFVHTRLSSKNNVVSELALKIKDKNYFRKEHPTSFYKIEMMKALRVDDLNSRFKSIFGPKNIPEIQTKKFVNDDMLTHKQYQGILKLAWNYAITNDDSQLKNYELLQEDITDLSLNENVDLYTGTHGVLSLKNSEGNFIDVYLKDQRFPVPKYLWFVVKTADKATAFVIFNKAQISEKDKQKDSFCTSKCEEITWIQNLLKNKQYKKVENGYVLCCDLKDFSRTVKEMPTLEGNFDLLQTVEKNAFKDA